MENLESEPLALRVQWIKELVSEGLPMVQARQLEDAIHFQRARYEDKPQPQWHQNGTLLSLTDSPSHHKVSARQAYLDLMMNVVQRIREKSPQESLDTILRNVHDDGPKDGIFSQWKTQLDSNLAFAKKVLEEKETSTRGIFQCPSCQSFDVDTEQKQTRSADEPMTIFCHCTKCNRRFVR